MTEDRLTTLYKTYGPTIYIRCRSMLSDEAEAHDATQETFLRVYRHLDEVPSQREALYWIYRVATNYCLNELRNRKNRPAVSAAETGDVPSTQDLERRIVNRDLAARLIAAAHPKVKPVAWLYHVGAEWVIQLYDLLLGASAGELSIGDRVPASLHFSPDGTRLLVSRRDGWYAGASAPSKGVSVWRMGDGRLLWEGAGRTSRIQDAAFSPDGSTLVLVGNGLVDGLAGTLDSPGVEVYDARDGTWLRTLDTIYTSRGSVRFSTDGWYLMVPTYRGGIEIWRTADWQRYETFGYPWTEDAVFLPNNRGVLEISTGVIWCES